jgi:hypothetical protein
METFREDLLRGRAFAMSPDTPGALRDVVE